MVKLNSVLVFAEENLLKKDLKNHAKYAIKNLNLLQPELIKQNIALQFVIINLKKEKELQNIFAFIVIINFSLTEDWGENIVLKNAMEKQTLWCGNQNLQL